MKHYYLFTLYFIFKEDFVQIFLSFSFILSRYNKTSEIYVDKNIIT